MQRLAAAQRLQFRRAKGQAVGQRPVLAAQRDAAGVARQAVEIGAVKAGEAFELVQRAGGVEGLRVQLQIADSAV